MPRWHCSSQTTKIEIEKRDGFRKLKFDLISRVNSLISINSSIDGFTIERISENIDGKIYSGEIVLNREWRRSYFLKNSIKFRLNVNK